MRAIDAVLECFLFVAPEPVTPAQVAAALELDERAAREALEGLRERYASPGLQVVRVAGGYQLCTRRLQGFFHQAGGSKLARTCKQPGLKRFTGNYQRLCIHLR